jgi:asparagine synthase (glutamine-hydrolysing)
MCGISGLAGCGDAQALARMSTVLVHRGPDDSGAWDKHLPDGSYLGLASRRLSILDLSPAGHMPMTNESGTLVITYNGEIYNYRDLRTELEAKGHRFRSHTDTEVVLHLYEQYGAECLNRLDGMFAFAVCDLRGDTPSLFLARDHFGIKPLYYTRHRGGLAFASEVKALLQVPGITAEIDLESLHQYLTFLWVPDPKTMFHGIFKLPAGHYAMFRDGNFEVKQYWDLRYPEAGAAYARSEEELCEEVRTRFQQSVLAQMVSDVPVGAFLSAGLDSSSIVAALAHSGERVHTYTVTYPDRYRVGENTLDDPEVATRLAQRLGVENERIVLEPEVAEWLPRLVWHMDEPCADPAIIAAYALCREARQHSTVLLSGVGGDEVFAGYRKYQAEEAAKAYQAVPAGVRSAVDRAVLSLPSFRGAAWKGKVRLAKKMARSAALDPVERFIRNCTYLDAEQKQALYASEVWAQVQSSEPAGQHYACFARAQNADFLHQMLYADTKIFMTSLNLTYADKMSMASSVEVRVPFLSRSLVEFVAREVPPALKLKGGVRFTTKYILRKAMEPWLPREVLQQPKAGFGAPVDYWLAHDLREMVDDLLSESQIQKRGLFRAEAVRAYVEEHRAGRQDWSMQIWQFLTLELWMRVFLDGGAESRMTERLAFPVVTRP